MITVTDIGGSASLGRDGPDRGCRPPRHNGGMDRAPSDQPFPASLRLLNVEEVAEVFGVAVIAVRVWVAKGLFPEPLRFGRDTLRWSEAMLEEHIDAAAAARPRSGVKR